MDREDEEIPAGVNLIIQGEGTAAESGGEDSVDEASAAGAVRSEADMISEVL